MLARVVLHPAEPKLPVDLSGHGCPRRQRSVAIVDDFSALLVRLQHLHAAKVSPVGSLTAALREEGGLVQHDLPAAFVFFAAKHLRREVKEMAVGIIKLLCHVTVPG